MAIKMGADIEFVFLNSGGSIVPACNHLGGTTHRFGTDGRSTIVEIRPFPSENPRDVITSMSRMIKLKVKREPTLCKYKWVGGSRVQGSSLGGHIHFGTGYNTTPRFEALGMLDALLTVMIALTDNPDDIAGRVNHGYGVLSSFRTQPHGWEYRSLPSYVGDKKLVEGVITLAQKIVEFNLTQPSIEALSEYSLIRVTSEEKSCYGRGEMRHAVRLREARIAFTRKWILNNQSITPIDYLFNVTRLAVQGKYSIAGLCMKKSWHIESPKPIEIRQSDIEREVVML